jgi:hypothetical protein
MVPYDIKLSYNDRPWQTVRIEIGHNEIGDADEAELEYPSDIADVLEQLGFPRPLPVPVMKLPYQIAQKLHEVTTEGAERPHDLIDLQLMCSNSEVDLAATRKICLRLFDYRRRQNWPQLAAEDCKRFYMGYSLCRRRKGACSSGNCRRSRRMGE